MSFHHVKRFNKAERGMEKAFQDNLMRNESLVVVFHSEKTQFVWQIWTKVMILCVLCSGLNIYIFLGTGRFSIRNDVTPDKVNYIPDIRQNFFFEKNSGH